MIKLIFFSVFTAIIATFVLQYDGQILINWQNYQIKLSLLAGVALLIICLIISYYFLNIIFNFKNKLQQLSYFFKSRTLQQHLTNLTQAFIFSASGDYIKAKQLIDWEADQPLSQLLSLQIAQSEGDDDKSITLLKNMLEHKSTKLLAYKGLIGIYIQQQNFKESLSFAEAAYKINSAKPWILKSLYEINLNLQNYDKALNYFNKYCHSTIIDISEQHIVTAKIYQLIAQDYVLDDKISKALNNYQQSVTLDPSKLEVWYQYIDLAINYDKLSKATEIIQQAWLHYQSYQLISKYIIAHPHLSSLQIIDMLEQLQQTTPNSDIGWLALAYAAIELNLPQNVQAYLNNISDQTLAELHQFRLLFNKNELDKITDHGSFRKENLLSHNGLYE